MFWLLGIYTNSTLSNSWVRCFVNLRYFCILSSFTSYSSFIYTITSLESLWRSRFLALSAFSTLSPISIPQYSASLLVAKNFSWTLYLSVSPSRVVELCIIHHSVSSVRPPLFGRVNSTMKSARACALMAVLGWYSISNWLSSIAH